MRKSFVVLRHPPLDSSKTMRDSLIRVGLVMEHSLAFYRQILRGVKTFATARQNWIFTPIAANRRALEWSNFESLPRRNCASNVRTFACAVGSFKII